MQYKLDGIIYEVVITKKANKNTYIKVKEDLTISVSTNYFATYNYISKLLDDNQDFLRRAIEAKEKQIIKHQKFNLLGKGYDLVFDKTINKIYVDGCKIYVNNRKDLDKWVTKEMKRIYKEHLDYWYDQFEENIPYPKLKIRTMKTRWGVNNKRDNSVTLNSKLIEYKLDKLDYVIIHELSHFVHFNHSHKFWELVSKYCPNYKQMRKDLKE